MLSELCMAISLKCVFYIDNNNVSRTKDLELNDLSSILSYSKFES